MCGLLSEQLQRWLPSKRLTSRHGQRRPEHNEEGENRNARSFHPIFKLQLSPHRLTQAQAPERNAKGEA